MFVKHWATKRELNQKYDSQNLNSYAFILLVIFYLQQIGDLPCLQDTNKIEIINGYNCAFEDRPEDESQKLDIEQLTKRIIGFFEFYGYLFDFESSVVSVRLGRTLGKSEKRWYPLRGDFQEKYANKMAQFETGFSPECAITEEQALEMLKRENILEQIAAPIPPFE